MFAQKLLVPAFAVLSVAAGKSPHLFIPSTQETAFAICDILQPAGRYGGDSKGPFYRSIG
jgi:hypothetical protein